MSKAIQGAAMLGAAVADGAAIFLTGGAALAAMPFLAPLMESLVVGGIAMEAGAIADALLQNRGVGITTRQPAAFRQIIYGTQRVGGVCVYQSTTGSELDQYNYIIVLAGHEVNAIVNLFLDGRQVFWAGSGAGYTVRNGIGFGGIAENATHIGPGGQHYNFGGTGHSGMYCEARFGDQAAGDYMTALEANDPNWAPSGGKSPDLMGCCYVYLKIEFNPTLFPNPPEIKFTIQGKNSIYDPRTDTTGYTANWALVVADVITDPVFGLNDPSVNQDQLIAAANICDELVDLANGGQEYRYQCHWHYDTGVDPGSALDTMMPAAVGRLSRIGGEWYIWPAAWIGSSFTWDQSSLTGPMQWAPNRSFRDLVNRVNGTYIAPNSPYNVAGNLYDGNGWYDGTIANQFPFAFQPTNYPQYAQDVLHGYSEDQWLDEDSGSPPTYNSGTTYGVGDTVNSSGVLYISLVASNVGNTPASSPTDWAPWNGVELPKEVVQSCVLSIAQAQRCAKIILLRNRWQGSGILEMYLQAWQMQPLDVMEFTFPFMSWSSKQLEVTATDFRIERGDDGAPLIRFQAGVQETDESIYEWDQATEEIGIYDVPANPAQLPSTIAPPTGLTLVSSSATALIGADGVITPRISATWTAPADTRVTGIQIQYQIAGAGSWTNGDLVSAGNTAAFITGVIAGQTYNVQIASVTATGAMSTWDEATGCLVAAPNSLQSSYAMTPQFALTQPTATTIDLAATSVSFGGLAAVSYAARAFTIAAPGSPIWYYVTIADSMQVGEGGVATLTPTCQASNALVGVSGNTYLGAILALPGGSATRMLAGGWPAPQTTQVGT